MKLQIRYFPQVDWILSLEKGVDMKILLEKGAVKVLVLNIKFENQIRTLHV